MTETQYFEQFVGDTVAALKDFDDAPAPQPTPTPDATHGAAALKDFAEDTPAAAPPPARVEKPVKLSKAQQAVIDAMAHGATLSSGHFSGYYNILKPGARVSERVNRNTVHALNAKGLIRRAASGSEYTGRACYELTDAGKQLAAKL